MTDAVERFKQRQYRVLVGLGHPERIQSLMSIASVLARRQGGRIVAAVVVPTPRGAEPNPTALSLAEAMVHRAEQFGAELGMAVEPAVWVADDIPSGIVTAAREVAADMVLLGYSPRDQTGGTDGSIPVRITEQVARIAHCALAIVAFDETGGEPLRLLMPIKEDFDAGITEDLAHIAALFGGAAIALIGLLPADLDEREFHARAEALRRRAEELDLGPLHRLDLRCRAAADCLFGAEIGQMSAAGMKPAFLLRADL